MPRTVRPASLGSASRLTGPRLTQLEDRLTPSPAGDPDSFFGAGGIATVNFPTHAPTTSLANITAGRGVAVQADGRILVAGTIPAALQTGATDIGVARLFPDGSPDPTFGGGLGYVALAFDLGGTVAASNYDSGYAIAVQPDGQILVAGSASTTANGKDFAVARLNTDGSYDPTFDTDGKVTIPFDAKGAAFNDDEAYGMVLQPDGKVVLVGYSRFDWAACRILPTGALDNTFGIKGQQTINFGTGFNADKATAVARQPDGKYVVAGYSDGNGSQIDFTTVRLNPNGALDITFGVSGKVVTGFDLGGSKNDYAYAVALQKDGKIVVAGSAEESFLDRADIGIVRLNANGSPDVTFDGDAKKVITFDRGGQNVDVANAILVQPDQQIVIGGSVEIANTKGFGASRYDFVTARLNTADGSFDGSWGTGGTATVTFALQAATGGGTNNNTGVYAMAPQPDGNIIVTGTAGQSFGVARILWTAPPPVPPPPVIPEPPTIPKNPVVPVSALPVGASPVFVGGPADGTTQVLLNRGTAGFFAGSAFDLFPGLDVEVRTVTADVNGDFVLDYVGATGPGVPGLVGVVDGKSGERIVLLRPFEESFTGGLFVSAADLTGDGKAEVIVTPDRGGGPVVATFDGARLSAGGDADYSVVSRFLGIDDKNFRGGARTTVGDLNQDGVPDLIVAAGFGGGPRVAVFNGAVIATGSGAPARLLPDFFAFEPSVRNGVFVAAGDVTADGVPDLTFAGGPGGAPRARIFSGKQLMTVGAFTTLDQAIGAQLADLFVGDSTLRGGVRVALRDVDGDGRSDLTAASGEGEAGRLRVYRATTLLTRAAPGPDATFELFGGQVLDGGVYVG